MSDDERAKLSKERTYQHEACRHLRIQIQNREGSQGDLRHAREFEEFQTELVEREARIREIDARLDP